MTLVLSLWAIPLVVPLIPTFIAINLLTCPRASLVVSSIVICRSPTVTDQMAHYVAPVAFGSTWTIMMIVAFRTQRLGPAVIFLLPVPCSVIFASILPLVRLLLVLIVLGSVIQLPFVLSLAFGKSADLFVHIFLKLHYWTLTLEVSQTSTLITGVSSLIPSSSRIPTLPGYVANLLAIPALYSTLPIVVTFPLSLVVSIICYLAFFLVRSGLLTYGPWCLQDSRCRLYVIFSDQHFSGVVMMKSQKQDDMGVGAKKDGGVSGVAPHPQLALSPQVCSGSGDVYWYMILSSMGRYILWRPWCILKQLSEQHPRKGSSDGILKIVPQSEPKSR
ncbi:hypothetical protein Tco_0505840 [Tanacetum coccineum]